MPCNDNLNFRRKLPFSRTRLPFGVFAGRDIYSYLCRRCEPRFGNTDGKIHVRGGKKEYVKYEGDAVPRW